LPLYEYQCARCGRFEIIRKFSDPPLLACPTCGGEVQKVLSAPAIQFKGTGWYITDYARKSGGRESGRSGEGKGGEAKGGESKGGESKGGESSSGAKDGGSSDAGSKADTKAASTGSGSKGSTGGSTS
jgi:putative FmdB family regulatory protein